MAGRVSFRRLIVALLLTALSVGRLSAAVPWIPFGPDGGDARRIAPDPRDANHLFMGTANGWLYESHNNGGNWLRLARVGKRDDLVLDSIVIDPRNSRHLIVGAFALDHSDGGVYITEDGGRTWLVQAEMRGQSVRALAISALNPNILIAGSLQGVFRSTDGGQRWQRISPEDSLEIHNVQSVAIDPKDPNVIYAGTWHLPWKTTDAGGHWENIKTGIIDDSDVFSIIVDPDHPQIVYASACSGIYKSRNSGADFAKIQGIPSTARRTRKLIQDPNDLNIVFAGTTEGLFRSTDAGAQWTRTTGPDLIVNDVEIDPADSKHVLIATDRSGVMASEDGGDTFRESNGGFSARQITTIERDRRRPATIFVGVVNDKEWGGVFESNNGGLNWIQRASGLDGRDVFSLGHTPDGTLIAGTGHGLFRLDSEAKTWSRIESAPPVGSPEEPVRPVEIAGRPPVAIGRNQFTRTGAADAARKPAVHGRTAAVTSKKSSAHAATKKTPTAGKHPPAKAKTAATTKKAPAHTHGKVVASTKKPAPAAPAHARTAVVAATPTVQPAAAAVLAASGEPVAAPPEAAKAAPARSFNGSVYALATAGQTMLAATSGGLLLSADQAQTWTLVDVKGSADWRFMTAAGGNVVAATLHTLSYSGDAGASWNPIPLPEGFTQIAAIAVEPTGAIWVGGREGVFVSTDAGVTWVTPKNLFLSSVNSLYYDEATNRVLVTTAAQDSYVFTVQLPERKVTYTTTGWSIRFARPIGDHLIAATLYDGVVIQPRMMASPTAPPPVPHAGPPPAH